MVIIQFEKIHISAFQQIEYISIVFLRRLWHQSVGKKMEEVRLFYAEQMPL